jgi:RNA polymerase sigma-70 factor (ECF subfamily)
LWRSLFAYTGSREVADDALAEAVAQALARGVDIYNPVAWIWRTAFTLAGAEMKRRGRTSHVLPEFLAYEMPASIDYVVQALARISPKQRVAVILCDYADKSTAEAASIMGITTATVHVHLSVARRRLRQLLEDDSDE